MPMTGKHVIPIKLGILVIVLVFVAAILIIYLTDRLKLTDNKATAIYHAFVCMAYFTPLFGAMLADGFLGKFRRVYEY
jgi:hypothetical protein